MNVLRWNRRGVRPRPSRSTVVVRASHPWTAARSVALALAVALPAALVVGVAGSADAAAGNQGTPSAPVTVFTEDFENGTGAQPILLPAYTGASPLDETYTADPAWDGAGTCDGYILSEQDPATPPTGSGCGGGWPSALTMAEALGSWSGGDATTNHALIGYTQDGNPGAGKVELQTDSPIPLSGPDRFLVVRSDAAAINCEASHPEFLFSVLAGSTAQPSFSAPIDPCDNPGGVDDGVDVGTYTGDQAILFGGTAAGIQLVNEQGSGTGNDAAIDNIQLLDATPQLDLTATTAGTPVGASANLTFTVTNTSELDAKDGWSFTANLPAGLTQVGQGFTTTCATATAAQGSGSGVIDVGGDLGAGKSSCTVTVQVTSIYGGKYTLCASQISNLVGLDAPGCASLTFVAPVFDARADAAQLTSPLLNIGPLAPAAYECETAPGAQSNSVVSAGLGIVGNLGALTTSASGSIAANGTRTAAAGAQTTGIDLLGGLITANEVATTAQAQQPLTSSGPGTVTTAGATTFTDLTVAGVAIAANPGPNSTINLPLVGSLVLNEQTSIAAGDGITVTALDLKLLTGTEVTISQSTAALLSATATCPAS